MGECSALNGVRLHRDMRLSIEDQIGNRRTVKHVTLLTSADGVWRVMAGRFVHKNQWSRMVLQLPNPVPATTFLRI